MIYKRKIKKYLSKIIINIILIIIALATIFPFYWMIVTALNIPSNIFKTPPMLIPKPITFDNFKKVFAITNILLAYFNSIKIALLLTIGTLFTSSMAAFAFAKLKFKGRDFWFAIFIATLLIPGQVTMLPLYVIFAYIGWIDSHLPLIVPGALINTYGVFMLRQFIVSIPDSLLESAEIDGCGYFRKYLHIIIPLTKPVLLTLGLFTIIGSWNNYFGQMIYIDSEELYTIPLLIASLKDTYSTGSNWGMIMAATTISIVPIAIIYLSVQKYFVQGIATTGIKN